MNHSLNQEKQSLQLSQFSCLLREWYSLNARLILDESIPSHERADLLISRQVYSAIFNATEGLSYDVRK